jgi:hypothetical protein
MARKPLTAREAWLRWLNVVLRGAHLIAVILLGAAVLGAPLALGPAALGVAASGCAMLALDTWRKPAYLREAAGVAVLAKLVLVAWLALDAGLRLPLFWSIVALSALFAHAPARLRHRIVLGRHAD